MGARKHGAIVVLFVAAFMVMAIVAACAQPTPTLTPAATPELTATPTSSPIPPPEWLSTGPRGVQFTSDFQLSEIFRDGEAFYYAFAMGPGGDGIYAVRRPLAPPESRERRQFEDAIVRIHGMEEGSVQAEEFLRFDELKEPDLWDPAVDLSGAILLAPGEGPSRGLLSVASNGDLFLVTTAWRSRDERYAHADPQPPPQGTSLIVRRSNGTLQKVVTVRELVESNLIEPETSEQRPSFAVAASAPYQLWLKVVTWPLIQPRVIAARAHFFQIQDPNRDGDWSDRTVQALSLPASLTSGDPSTGDEPPWFLRQLAAEPSLDGEDRTGSFLLAVTNSAGEYRIWRVSDPNRDGDALDPGELESLFTAEFIWQDSEPNLIPRRVVGDGRVVRQELVVAGLTRPTRVSRISTEGEAVDIARGFRRINEMVADSEGNIYIATQIPASQEINPTFLIYRLQPRPAGSVPEVQPTAIPLPATRADMPPPPRVAFLLEDWTTPGEEKGEAFVIGADGAGPVKLVPGEHIGGFCPSADGSLFGYWSAEEVPHESFVYVANSDGSNPRKVTEEYNVFWCRFTADYVPLLRSSRPGDPLIRYELESGEETTLLTGGDRLVISPDGQSFLFVSGLDLSRFPPTGEESLEVLEIDTGERRLLDGPLPEGSYRGLQWSSDARFVAYLVGPSPHQEPSPAQQFNLYVTDVSRGEAKLVYQFEGDEPSLYWSAGGRWFLALVAGNQLLLIDTEDGEAQEVVGGEILFVGWSPEDDSFVYATSQALYLESVAGERKELATATEGECSYCMEFFGWSPDGRYLGLADYWQTIAVLDITTREVRIVFQADGEDVFVSPHGWWR